jgi:archaeal flagellar protein FlaI
MGTITLPFSIEKRADARDFERTREQLGEMLPKGLREVAENNPRLFEYISWLPISKIGVPEYAAELTREMGDNKAPNIIYPVKQNGIFVHILFDDSGFRHNYIQIEPTTTLQLDKLMTEVEDACIAISEKIPGINPDVDREKQLLAYLDQVTAPPVVGTSNFFLNFIKRLLKQKKDDAPVLNVKVSPQELEGIKYLFVRDKVKMGILDPIVIDPYIEDISCSGMGNIFIEHKIFKSLKSTINFSTFEDLDEFVIELAERIKKPVTYKNPIADATLPDGSRINIVYGRDISKRGSNFSIRKFSETPLSIFEIVDFGTINYQMLAYLSLAISNGMNVFVAGESASGKTALLNAVTTFIPPLSKIITIEDTPELQVPHKNWIREVVNSSKAEDGGSVTMFDLLRAALRQRPNEILIGEIRGKEGNIAFQAMQTGHSCMATFHAATVEKLIQRITGEPISVPRAYIDNLNIAVLMGMVRLPNGKIGRRITSIAEIVGWDPLTQTFNIAEAFHHDEANDSFDFVGYMTSFIMEFKIAPRLGIPSNKKGKIYEEIDRRANILKELHKGKGITGFYEVLDVLSKAQQQGLF